MPEKKAVLWNAMLSGYAQNGFAEEAVELFNEMMNASVQTDKTFWAAVIPRALLDMYAKYGSLETTSKIFNDLGPLRNSIDTSHVTIEHRNIEMDGYAEHGRVGVASDDLESVTGYALDLR
ncbi:hypothetical protein LguiA_008186 [Lonicera macranthoides]